MLGVRSLRVARPCRTSPQYRQLTGNSEVDAMISDEISFLRVLSLSSRGLYYNIMPSIYIQDARDSIGVIIFSSNILGRALIA